MTLVIAIATRPFIVLLTDRRIATPLPAGGRARFAVRDSDTKSVIMNGTHALGFSGLGTVGPSRQRMEFWMMDAFRAQMVPGGLADWPDQLARKFGAVCEQVGYFGEHHFVAPGYFRADDGSLQPEIVTISNDVFPHSFDVSRLRLEGSNAAAAVVCGEDPPEHAEKVWRATVESACRRSPLNMATVINAVLQLWADTSSVRETVGKTAICTSFPMSAVPLTSGGALYLSPPTAEVYLTHEVSLTYELDPPQVTTGFIPARISEALMIGGVYSVTGTGQEPIELGPLDRMSGDA